MQLEKSVVVVTGGASGLGAGTVSFLRQAGAIVASFDRTAPHRELDSPDYRAYEVDITDEEAVAARLDEVVRDLGPIRAVINCAGIVRSQPLLSAQGRFPTDLFACTVAVNLTGTFIVMAYAAERMSTNEPTADGERGVIVNVASIAGLDGSSSIAYAASKGGVISMTLTGARQLADYGIRVNTIAPGYMDTAMFEGLDEQYRTKLLAGNAFPKKLADPRDFGALAAHIIENTFVNGETIRFDAGARV